MTRLATLLAILWSLAAQAAPVPSPATPGEHIHVVAAGETLSSLASQYYGAAWKAVYLTARNGLADGKDLTAGARLIVPASYTYRVHRGDTAAELGKKQLGERERGKAILLENGLKPGADLPVGTEILMPFHLKYAAETGDTWAKLAARYYSSAERAGFLRDYNPGVTLAAGVRLIVPIFDRSALDVQNRKVARSAAVAAKPPPAKAPTPAPAAPAKPAAGTTPAASATPKPAPAAATPPAPTTPTATSPAGPAAVMTSAAPAPAASTGAPVPAPSPPPSPSPAMPSIAASVAAAAANPVDAGSASASADLPRVVTPALRATLAKGVEEYRQGEFESGCAKLEQVLAQGPLPAPERNTALAYLGFCAVAAGNRAAAADYFRKWLELDPRAELDPVTTSPKIRAIFQEVAESIRAEVSDAH